MLEQDKYTDPGLGWLDQALENYSRSDIYPFHMPGHKRRKIEQNGRDSTETGNVKNGMQSVAAGLPVDRSL